MARDLTAGFVTEIEAQSLNAAMLFQLEFDSGDIFFQTDYGTVNWNGDDYLGVGDLLAIEPIKESSVIKAVGTTLVLTGVKTSLISLALDEDYQGRPVYCHFAVLDSTRAIISDPYLLFKGKADLMRIVTEGEMSTISLTVENELIDLFKARERNYTPEDQKSIYPADLGLDFLKGIQDAEVVWKDKNA